VSRIKHIAAGVALTAVAGGAMGVATQAAAAATAHPASTAAVLKVASVKVSVGTTSSSHQLLVNAKGLPVYMLTGDSATAPKCKSTSCMTFWPPVKSTTMKPSVGTGVKGKIGVWHHNGFNQVTLNGHPLYTYAQDSKDAGRGEGLKSFGGTWELMTAAGTAMTKSSSSGSGGGSSWS
jgi:predicted lipoprotein with Yx(FWY)xxD motif